MLKSKVGYSINPNHLVAGLETAKQSTKDFSDVKLNFLYTSEKSDIKRVVKGIREVTSAPIIGCTSSRGVIIPDGFITSEDGFSAMLSLDDLNLSVGVAGHEAGKDPRAIGRKVALEAVQNANSTRSPAYFYMVASPKEEEDYLMGIQDVIFYTDNEIMTKYNGLYNETNKMGLITEVKDNRTLVSIDEVSSLKKYAHWINENPNNLKDKDLLIASVTKPLGIKDQLGNLTVIRHPMYGNDMGTRTVTDDTITLGNNVVPGTAIVQLEATKEELSEAPITLLKTLNRDMYEDPSAYILIHDAARMMEVEDKINEIAEKIIKETNNVPFIMPFTFGEYGYEQHSSNICGGLMLSFTAIGNK